MLSSRFNDLWRTLTTTFHRYHDADRTAATVVELAQIRIDLDDVRAEIATERQTIRIDAASRRSLQHRSAPLNRIDGDVDDIRLAAFQQFPQQ